MENRKETFGKKFIKRLSLFLAGALTALGINYAVNTLPEGKGDKTDKEPAEITDTLLEDQENNFKQDLKYTAQTTELSPAEQEVTRLENLMGNVKDEEKLLKLMLQDIKERYVQEYNKVYDKDYSASDLKMYYSYQSYAYIKDGKFYGKDKVDGAKAVNNEIAYRIYDNTNKQLEAVLDGNSSEDVNILGKYMEALTVISKFDHNPAEISFETYKKAIKELYDENSIKPNNNGGLLRE